MVAANAPGWSGEVEVVEIGGGQPRCPNKGVAARSCQVDIRWCRGWVGRMNSMVDGGINCAVCGVL